jgi:thiol-disulfide isomerase/thioredoxin
MESSERIHRTIILRSGLRSFAVTVCIVCLSSIFLSSCKTRTHPTPKTGAARDGSALRQAKVTQIDAAGLKQLLRPNGKPLLINFWATWCGPCREEFPDLVRIADDHKAKIDVITISLDEPSEIDGEVAAFLAEMGSESPAYLLKTPDEDAAIGLVSKDWRGALPFTILFNTQGEAAYTKEGRFVTDVLEAEIDKL